eukprot:355906-Chlamydomonas_euryale.AAC.9
MAPAIRKRRREALRAARLAGALCGGGASGGLGWHQLAGQVTHAGQSWQVRCVAELLYARGARHARTDYR